jgi:3'-phosphoadenosine 5'-phosphosulfate sulfotransferase (PAPS reductase)/FAD synthetase
MRGEPVLSRVPDLQSNIMSVAEKLSSIKPRTVLYLFSGGKDSSLALLLTRDCVKRLCEDVKCRVYMLYVYITGNTHPLNAYASYAVMLWHRKNYGFEVVVKARDRLFQEYMAKYGLQTGPGRWCYSEFKEKIFVETQRRLPQPQVLIDGMSPSDSKARSEKIKAELELVERYNGLKFYAWHPLYSLYLSSEEKLKLLEQHEEFKPVVNLYREYGDSLNCIVCPYKSTTKMLQHHAAEDLSAIYYFVKEALTSKKRHRKFSKLVNKTLIDN